MRAVLTSQFATQLAAAAAAVQRAFIKQLAHLLRDIRHPLLHAKKYDETRGLWQARVNDSWRFYFTIEGDAYVFRGIIAHPM